MYVSILFMFIFLFILYTLKWYIDHTLKQVISWIRIIANAWYLKFRTLTDIVREWKEPDKSSNLVNLKEYPNKYNMWLFRKTLQTDEQVLPLH